MATLYPKLIEFIGDHEHLKRDLLKREFVDYRELEYGAVTDLSAGVVPLITAGLNPSGRNIL